MLIIRAISAVLYGFRVCFGDPHIRKLAARPWLIGMVTYFATAFAAIKLHAPILNSIVHNQSGWLGGLTYYLAWIFIAVLLLLAATILSIGLVFLFAGVFQTDIAKAVLILSDNAPPPNTRGTIAETSRTVVVETQKLLFLLPLMLLTIAIGFIPLMTPVALVFGSWLLAYQFVDSVLDLFNLTVRERLRFARENWLQMIGFGLTLAILWAVPLMGLLLPPVAVAAAARYLSSESLKERLPRA